MIRPFDVAHVNLNVTDLNRAIQFYTQVLGFRIAFQYEDAIAWLNFGQYRDDVGGLGHGFHDVALYKVTSPAPTDRKNKAPDTVGEPIPMLQDDGFFCRLR